MTSVAASPSSDIESLGRTLGRLRDPTDGRAGDEILRALLDEGLAAIGALAGGIFMLDDGGASLELTIAVRYPEPLADRYRLVPLAADVPLVETVKTMTPIFLGSLAGFVARYPAYARMHPEIAQNAFVSLPLVCAGRCVGGIAIGFATPRSFTPEERASLLALGERCTRELERLRLVGLEQSSRQPASLASQRLERLHAFTGTLAQTITPAQVIEAVIDMGIAATSARSSALWLRSPDGSDLVLGHKRGSGGPGSAELTRVPLDGPARLPIVDVARDGVVVWIESGSQLGERYPGLETSSGPEQSFAGLPLVAEGRRIGTLTYGFEGPHRFLEDERAFLQVIAWYSAQALQRANLYAAERVAKERAEDNQRRSELIADIDVLLASSLDYAGILSDVARAAVPRFAHWCVLELADHRLRGTPPIAGHADPAKVPLVLELRRRIRDTEDFNQGIEAVLRSGISRLHPFLSPELFARNLADDTMATLASAIGVSSALVVPIAARGRVLGAILFGRAHPARPYDEQDLAVGEDLGRRIGLAIDNARLYQEAREADRLKDEFIAMLSHELRNPLAPIVTAVELMERKGGGSFTWERAMIVRNVRHLVRLLDDLLDVARTTRGKVRLAKERCALASIVAGAVEMASPLVEQRRHRLAVSGPARGIEVIADNARLTQAIANLVTNAAKYTSPGGAISVTVTQDGNDGVVTVRDSGLGIAPELLPRIFDPFVQGATSLDRAQGGLGIGLTVAKNLVSLHGGTLSAESGGLGQGSEFVVRLPLAGPTFIEVAVAGTAAHEAPIPEGHRYRVLAVDDNQDAGQMLGRALESLGCSTLVVQDGLAAITSAASFDPQLILLDIGLPGLDGYEVARRLRESRGDAPLRIVAVTGYGQPSDRLRSQGAGFDGHIIKPVSLEALQRLLAGM